MEYEDLCCPICISELVNPHLTNCGHLFCHDCISTYLLTSKVRPADQKCPICRAQIKRKKVAPLENMAQTIELLSEDADKPARLRSYLRLRCMPWSARLWLQVQRLLSQAQHDNGRSSSS